jgi:hypothetical protein
VSRNVFWLSLVPSEAREDAVQESWVAYLAGRDPVRAVNSFAHRERWHKRQSRYGAIG